MKITGEGFGRRLAAIRAERGLTQRELATAIGSSRQAVCRWENARAVDIRIGELCKLAGALDCRVRDLLAPFEAPIPPRASSPRRYRRHRRAIANPIPV
jgi:transcriptional regulator with XRE-family HTH domain